MRLRSGCGINDLCLVIQSLHARHWMQRGAASPVMCILLNEHWPGRQAMYRSGIEERQAFTYAHLGFWPRTCALSSSHPGLILTSMEVSFWAGSMRVKTKPLSMHRMTGLEVASPTISILHPIGRESLILLLLYTPWGTAAIGWSTLRVPCSQLAEWSLQHQRIGGALCRAANPVEGHSICVHVFVEVDQVLGDGSLLCVDGL